MKTHLLVESNQSAILLAKLLNPEQIAGLIEIRAAAPSSSLYSAARTFLAVRAEPVVLLLDADSTDPDAVTRRRLTAEEVVGDVAASAPFRVLVAVPSLEALLFLHRDPVVRAFGAAAADQHILEMGRLNPHEALKRLGPAGQPGTTSLNLVRALNDEDIEELRSTTPILDILDFLRELQYTEAAANTGQ
jgi:hypothetical protein